MNKTPCIFITLKQFPAKVTIHPMGEWSPATTQDHNIWSTERLDRAMDIVNDRTADHQHALTLHTGQVVRHARQWPLNSIGSLSF